MPNSAPAKPANAARDRERRHLVAPHVQADELRALGVLADRGQHPAEGRAHDPPQDDEADAGEHHDQQEVLVGGAQARRAAAARDIQPKSGYGTFDRPCSPPVTEFHLKQIAQTIWANASVSIAK